MVKLEDKALWINGKRELIVSGEIHYYRLEKSEWQDRICRMLCSMILRSGWAKGILRRS